MKRNSQPWYGVATISFIVALFLAVPGNNGVCSFSLISISPSFVDMNSNKRLFPTGSRTQISLSTSTQRRTNSLCMMAQVSQKEAQGGIDKVVKALRSNKDATSELGKLVKVTNVLGFGSPRAGVLAVRFNASFQKGGMGRSAVPLPFGLGQSNQSEGRGTMVGQVKASLDAKTGKILDCSVFRDLGYGRAFNLKV